MGISGMEKLLSFIREYLNTRWERKQFCKSCELLKTELDRANFEKKQLMDKFVLISVPPVMRDEPVSQPLMPKNVPWKIKRELLEAEDRAKAAALRRQRE